MKKRKARKMREMRMRKTLKKKKYLKMTINSTMKEREFQRSKKIMMICQI